MRIDIQELVDIELEFEEFDTVESLENYWKEVVVPIWDSLSEDQQIELETAKGLRLAEVVRM